jgi:hypothetical protein
MLNRAFWEHTIPPDENGLRQLGRLIRVSITELQDGGLREAVCDELEDWHQRRDPPLLEIGKLGIIVGACALASSQ